MVLPVVVLGLAVVGYLVYLRTQELFRIAVRDGKPTVVRGHVPGGLLGDFASAVRGVKNGSISAHKAVRGGRLSFGGGIDEDTGQRLRNIFGLYPVSKLRGREVNARQAVSDIFMLSWFVSLIRSFFRH